MTIKVCLAGATGWAGSALAKAIHAAADLRLTGAVSRTWAGKALGDAIGVPGLVLPVSGKAADALKSPCEVFVEFTKPEVARENILAALDAGAHVVVGTSGLTDADYADIDAVARVRRRGVLAAGNFALTVVLLQKFAETAARYIPYWEVIDYAHADKIDAPSGTARELAHRLGSVRQPLQAVSLDAVSGPKASRGATLNGVQVHSLRLPGHVIAAEVIFGLPDQKLILKHEAGASATPYVDGALLAIRKVGTFSGLRRGLDTVMDLEGARP